MRNATLVAAMLGAALAGVPWGSGANVTRREERDALEPMRPTRAELEASRLAVLVEAEEHAHREEWNRQVERKKAEKRARPKQWKGQSANAK